MTTDADGLCRVRLAARRRRPAARWRVRLARQPPARSCSGSSFDADRRAPAATGGGCDITVGPGGQFERLDGDLLARLLEQNRGAVCICFMPGTHDVDSLVLASQNRAARLSLHGCGPPTTLHVSGRFQIGGLAALELRDLAIVMAEGGVLLQSNGEICDSRAW